MDGLLPVIIALIISAIFSVRKKKQEQDDTPFPSEESPWDDLMREWQEQTQQASSSPQTKSESVQPEPVQPESVQPQVRTEAPILPSASKPFVTGQPTATTLPTSCSYEELPDEEMSSIESVSLEEIPVSSRPEESSFGGPVAATVASVDSVLKGTALSPNPDVQIETPATTSAKAAASRAEEEVDTPFASGFDPRMAVLYSEVFRPKYLD